MRENELDVVNIRLVPDRTYLSDRPIRCPDDAIPFIAEHLADYDREVLAVLNLNTKGKVINLNFVSVGTINASLVEPREVFKSVVLSNAAALIMIHVHPSGDPTPSREDLTVTDRIEDIADLFGVHLLDHVIVGCGNPPVTYSFAEHDMIKKKPQKKAVSEPQGPSL